MEGHGWNGNLKQCGKKEKIWKKVIEKIKFFEQKFKNQDTQNET